MPRAKKIKSPLSKEDVLKQMKGNAEFQTRLKFLKEKFWPLLCETAGSIEDASTFLGGFNTALMQAFLSRMKEVKFGDLKLDDQIAGDFESYKPLLKLFDDMNVFEAKTHIEGMKGEIELFRKDEDRKRALNTLKPVWVDEI